MLICLIIGNKRNAIFKHRHYSPHYVVICTCFWEHFHYQKKCSKKVIHYRQQPTWKLWRTISLMFRNFFLQFQRFSKITSSAAFFGDFFLLRDFFSSMGRTFNLVNSLHFVSSLQLKRAKKLKTLEYILTNSKKAYHILVIRWFDVQSALKLKAITRWRLPHNDFKGVRLGKISRELFHTFFGEKKSKSLL